MARLPDGREVPYWNTYQEVRYAPVSVSVPEAGQR